MARKKPEPDPLETIFDRLGRLGVGPGKVPVKLVGGPGDGCLLGISAGQFLRICKTDEPLIFETREISKGRHKAAIYCFAPTIPAKSIGSYSLSDPVRFVFAGDGSLDELPTE